MSYKLRNKRIGMAADKGNKKGVGHLAKVLTEWDIERFVVRSLQMCWISMLRGVRVSIVHRVSKHP